MGALQARLLFFAFVILTIAISYNAIFLQKGRHPAPISGDASRNGGAAMKSATSQATTARQTTGAVRAAVSGDTVRAIQRELAAKGYEPGEIDGVAGVLTRAAIMAYQSDVNLPVTGEASTELLEHIVLGGPGAAGPPSGEGAVPRETVLLIKAVQEVLSELGYAPGPVDGVVGSSTQQAIQSFEREHKLPVTGRISGRLLKEIMRVTDRRLALSASP